MLNPPANTKAFICSVPVDMRASFDSLSGMIESHFQLNPLSGDLFVFLSRRRDRMKVLAWELDGYILYYKRLEEGTFSWIHDLDLAHSCEIPAVDFAILLGGVMSSQRRPNISRETRKKVPLHLV